MSKQSAISRALSAVLVRDGSYCDDELDFKLGVGEEITVLRRVGYGSRVPDVVEDCSADVTILYMQGDPEPALVQLDNVVKRVPSARVVLMGRCESRSTALVAVRRGASGFLHEWLPRQQLQAALRLIAEGLDSALILLPRDSPRTSRGRIASQTLSKREREVIDLMASAYTNYQIARRLGITEGTVKRHVNSIFMKLRAVSRIDAVNKYLG